MKPYISTILLISLVAQFAVSQVVTQFGFEQDAKRKLFSVPDSIVMKEYTDSLAGVSDKELLTGYIFSSLHELVSDALIIVLDDEDKSSQLGSSDNLGRFFLPVTSSKQELKLRIIHPEYYDLDTTVSSSIIGERYLEINLEARYKIMLRGRVFAGNVPIENVDVTIKHGTNTFTQKTLGCYTDDENYWNCLYLGMFRQPIIFENPKDTVSVELMKDGFIPQSARFVLADYTGEIADFKLKYNPVLANFPRHNISLQFGHTFQKTWAVGVSYLYQLEIGKFNRLGIGLQGSLLLERVETSHSTFQGMPDAVAESYYSLPMLGPIVNISLTKPSARYFNTYIGTSVPFIFSQNKVSLHPYIGTKFFVDLNKAFFFEIKYIDYSLDISEYAFNPYGNSLEERNKQEFQKVFYNLGLLVTF